MSSTTMTVTPISPTAAEIPDFEFHEFLVPAIEVPKGVPAIDIPTDATADDTPKDDTPKDDTSKDDTSKDHVSEDHVPDQHASEDHASANNNASEDNNALGDHDAPRDTPAIDVATLDVPAVALPPSSIQVTHKSSRSYSTFLKASPQSIVSRMIKPKETATNGSPALQPYNGIHKQCNIRKLDVHGIKIYEINSRSRSTRYLFASVDHSNWQPGETQAREATKQGPCSDPLSLTQTESLVGEDVRTRDWATHYVDHNRRRPRYIYYFAGGGFQTPASKEHWKLCAYMAHELTQRGTPTTVYLVSYPLAPNCPAGVTLPMLKKLYYTLFPAISDSPNIDMPCDRLTPVETHHSYMSSRDTKYPEIVFAGDAAGANIALSLTLHVLSTDPCAPAPDSLMLISPDVDMRTTNPEIPKIGKKDPVLSLSTISRLHAAWCGADVNESDPRVSPTLGDLSLLFKNHIVVNGILGTNDILTPDATIFMDKLEKEKVRGNWLVWDKQIHCFPLLFSHNVPDGKDGVEWMLQVLGKRSQ